MARIRLSWRARQALEHLAQSGSKARMVRRAQTLLWLDQGEAVQAVAQRLGLTRRALEKIVARYQARLERPVVERIEDQPHPGRPAAKRQQVAQVLAELLPQPPADFGYRGFAWTTPMLRCQVERRLQTSTSERTIRRALRAMRYRYKRPRYVLARRSATWRQAKGGSKTA
jgi:transposase